MYATIADLAEWYGITVDALLVKNAKAEIELEGIARRMAAYIIPNVPRNSAADFVLAVFHQYEHEQGQTAKILAAAAGQVAAFQIGNWSATLRDGRQAERDLFPAGLSPSARGILLEAGLLYRGGIPAC